MESEISKKIIKPQDCVLAFGIPTAFDSFIQDKNSSNKEFAKLFKGGWAQYFSQIVSNIEAIEPTITRLGVSIVRDLTLEKFGRLFRKSKFDVVILFSHWAGDAVEFHDGLVNISVIAETVSNHFSGVVDLCVCHPESLTIALRRYRPNCLVRYVQKRATPYFWLYFYFAVFKYLNDTDSTYLQALEKVIEAFVKIE